MTLTYQEKVKTMYAQLGCVVALVLCLIGCSDPQPSQQVSAPGLSGRGKIAQVLSVPVCESVPHFTDIRLDPVVPGGLTETEIQDLIAQGWVDGRMIRSQDNCLMMFKSMMNGQPEWRCGTIPQGTRILKNPAGDIGTAAACGNPVGIETIKDSWFPRQ